MKNAIFAMLIPTLLSGQINAEFSVSGGASVLTHRANLETTTYANLYRFVANSAPNPDNVTFEDFKKAYSLNTNVYQPRATVRMSVNKSGLPFRLDAEIGTSPSTMTAPRAGASFGFSDKFYISERGYIKFFSGYKFVKDWGWGTQTLINSTHNRRARQLMQEWFVATDDLGINYAHLICINGGIGFQILERYSLRLEPYYEVDISSYRKKPARMTNFGANLLIVCELW